MSGFSGGTSPTVDTRSTSRRVAPPPHGPRGVPQEAQPHTAPALPLDATLGRGGVPNEELRNSATAVARGESSSRAWGVRPRSTAAASSSVIR